MDYRAQHMTRFVLLISILGYTLSDGSINTQEEGSSETFWIWSKGCFDIKTPARNFSMTTNTPDECFRKCGETTQLVALKGDICQCRNETSNIEAYNFTITNKSFGIRLCPINGPGSSGTFATVNNSTWTMFQKASISELQTYSISNSSSGCVTVTLTEGSPTLKYDVRPCNESYMMLQIDPIWRRCEASEKVDQTALHSFETIRSCQEFIKDIFLFNDGTNLTLWIPLFHNFAMTETTTTTSTTTTTTAITTTTTPTTTTSIKTTPITEASNTTTFSTTLSSTNTRHISRPLSDISTTSGAMNSLSTSTATSTRTVATHTTSPLVNNNSNGPTGADTGATQRRGPGGEEHQDTNIPLYVSVGAVCLIALTTILVVVIRQTRNSPQNKPSNVSLPDFNRMEGMSIFSTDHGTIYGTVIDGQIRAASMHSQYRHISDYHRPTGSQLDTRSCHGHHGYQGHAGSCCGDYRYLSCNQCRVTSNQSCATSGHFSIHSKPHLNCGHHQNSLLGTLQDQQTCQHRCNTDPRLQQTHDESMDNIYSLPEKDTKSQDSYDKHDDEQQTNRKTATFPTDWRSNMSLGGKPSSLHTGNTATGRPVEGEKMETFQL